MDRSDGLAPLELGGHRTVERRIGVRVPAPAGIDVEWLVPAEIDLRDDGWIGHLADVSVTGASVDAPAGLPIDVSAPATLRYGATESKVVVRHASTTDHPGVTRYGLEWTRLEDPLRGVVFGLVSDARRVGA
jgi:hypothetical protein